MQQTQEMLQRAGQGVRVALPTAVERLMDTPRLAVLRDKVLAKTLAQ